MVELCEEAADYSISNKAIKPLLKEIKASADDFEFETAAEKAEEILALFE